MVIKLVILINLILILYSLFHFVRCHIFMSNVKNRNMNSTKTKANIIIAIPCLREQKTIVKTVAHFKNILPKEYNIPIVLITTEKEKKENNILTTKEVIENKILPQYKDVYLFHYPNTDGYKSDQLNYAIDNLKKVKKDLIDEKSYFCTYDADSLPNKNTFDEVLISINQNDYPEVIQQYSYAMSNFDKLNIMLKGFAIYQSNFEIKCGLLNSYFKTRTLHTHVVGHGLFIRLDTVKNIGCFNSEFWCEDIYMSGCLRNDSINICPLMVLENMETPNSLSNLTKQNGVWWSTTAQSTQLFRDISKKKNGLSKNGFIAFLSEARACINWIVFPFIIFFTIMIPIIELNLIILLISILAYLFYIFAYSSTTIKIINKLEKEKFRLNISLFFGTVIATLISNIGPLYYLIVRPKEKHKTER